MAEWYPSERFKTPSSSLSLGRLMSRTRPVTAAAVALAAAVHLSLAIITPEHDDSAPEPSQTRFIKRRPRFTKRFEHKKRVRHRPRKIQRRMTAVRPRINRRAVRVSTSRFNIFDAVSRPDVAVNQMISLESVDIGPQLQSADIHAAQEAGHEVDLGLDLVDLNALDTGRNKAMVIQDPHDKRSVSGFFHMAHVGSGLRALNRIVERMNEYTDVKTDLSERFSWSSPQLMEIPIVFAFGMGEQRLQDLEGIGGYLARGGFMFLEIGRPGSATDIVAKEQITLALETQGINEKRDYVIERLSNDHPLYTSFFTFSGPPSGNDNWRMAHYSLTSGHGTATNSEVTDYLEGVTVDGRLAVLISHKSYNSAWTRWGDGNPDTGNLDPTRQFQFAVNIIIFALTQEGSVTQQTMQNVNY
ncbi:MAG: DUF4159 domain-containing protein [Candidatus Latescibacteria bacterium]|nr:DUF4159 domain-containing protein [Candidatus Latescibacterota bacterium]